MSTKVTTDWAAIWSEAKAAGELAAKATVPTPMVVTDAHLDGTPVEGGNTYWVQGGACGFAYITIKPARGGLVQYLKSIGVGWKGYYGGYEVPAHPRTFEGTPLVQSVEINGAYARAVAEVLRGYGVPASSYSRLD